MIQGNQLIHNHTLKEAIDIIGIMSITVGIYGKYDGLHLLGSLLYSEPLNVLLQLHNDISTSISRKDVSNCYRYIEL